MNEMNESLVVVETESDVNVLAREFEEMILKISDLSVGREAAGGSVLRDTNGER